MSNGKTSPVTAVANYDFYKTNALPREAHLVMPGGPSMTRQEFAEECDINILMKRYEMAGNTVNNLPRDPRAEPMYVDFAYGPTDLLSYMELMQNAENAFMTLPAVVRREFENNAVMFVDFASDPDNIDQMRAWGLAPPAPAKPPEQSSPAAAPPGAAAPGGAPAGFTSPPTHGST
jgi:hypothetical protein